MIKIIKLIVQNFKGCKDRTVEFGNVTNIYGANAAGKTTLADAIYWLLFNKNSLGDEKFNVRPLDERGNRIDNVEISVYGVFDVNGKQVTLKKTQKQKWVKKRGSGVEELQGNENLYEIHEIPKSEKEFKEFIDSMIKEEVFKLITNPQAFVSKKWKEQRDILLKLVSEITDLDVAGTDSKFQSLISDLEQFSIDDLMKREAKPLAEWKKRQDVIPALIDEVYKSIVDVDLSVLELQKNSLIKQINEVEQMEEDSSKAYEEVEKVRSQIMELKFKQSAIAQKANDELLAKKREVRRVYDDESQKFSDAQSKQSQLERSIESAKSQIERLGIEREQLLSKWHEVNNLKFNEDELTCVYCGQHVTELKQLEIMESFDSKKKSDLDSITSNGKRIKSEIEKLEESISTMEKQVENIKEVKIQHMGAVNEAKKELDSLLNTVELSIDEEYTSISKQISELNKQLENMNTGADYRQQLRIKKLGLKEELSIVEKKFSVGAANERARDRIEELKVEQKDVAQKVANQEKKLFLLEEFTKKKMEMISSNINSLFKVVTFKLFENQINGGFKETCECMVNGVPYSDLNSAGKLQAGLDIIRCLQKHHDAYAPIIIDNRESVTDIPELDCQVINLFVSKEDKVLRVEVA